MAMEKRIKKSLERKEEGREWFECIWKEKGEIFAIPCERGMHRRCSWTGGRKKKEGLWKEGKEKAIEVERITKRRI